MSDKPSKRRKELESDEEMDSESEADEMMEKSSSSSEEEDDKLKKVEDASSSSSSDNEDDDSEDGDSKPKEGTSSETVKKSSESSKPKKVDEYAAVRKEISQLSFEDLQKLKNKMGLKLFNQIYYGKAPKKAQPIPQRANKNRPQELSSKKPPKRNRLKQKAAAVVSDPRFDDRCGEFDEQQFKESYGFINDVRDREKTKLKKMLDKAKNPEKKHKIAYLLNRMNQQEDTKQKKEKSLELKRKIKKLEREDVAQGRTPYYLKKSDQKKLELAEKFKELKKSGKLDKFMSKKRKKLAQKDRKKMPDV